MSEPIVFISTHRIKEGKLEGFTQLSAEVTPQIEGGKPQTLVFQAYLNEESTEVTIVHVFPDADAMDVHFQGAGERSARAWEFLQPLHFAIYGKPSDQVLSGMRQEAMRAGVDLTITPRPLFGFIRLTSG